MKLTRFLVCYAISRVNALPKKIFRHTLVQNFRQQATSDVHNNIDI
jgi:hypothetical protein